MKSESVMAGPRDSCLESRGRRGEAPLSRFGPLALSSYACERNHIGFVMAEKPKISTQVHSAVGQGWVEGGSFFGSLISGVLLGYVADRLLGTSPWLVIAGVLLGAYSGFMRVWRYAKVQGEREDEERRQRGR